MESLQVEVPGEFSDDERWYRFFTKKSILVLLIMGMVSVMIIKIFAFIGVPVVGIYLALILTGIVMLLVMLPIPQGDILHGSGSSCDVILLRMIARKRHARIYVHGICIEEE